MRVPTPIRHQDKSRDLSTPILQPEPLHAISVLTSPWALSQGLGREMEEQRNEIHCHLRNLRGEDPALDSLLPSAKMCKQSKRKTKVQSSVVPSPLSCPLLSNCLGVKSLGKSGFSTASLVAEHKELGEAGGGRVSVSP